jgi:hypothetical protein
MSLKEKLLSGCFFLLSVLWLPAAAHADQTFVIDYEAGTGFLGALFMVDPVSGTRTLISDFGNAGQGPTGTAGLAGIAIQSSGQILVTDEKLGQVVMGRCSG